MLLAICAWCRAPLGVSFPDNYAGRTEVSHGLCQRCYLRESAEYLATLDRMPVEARERMKRDAEAHGADRAY